MTNASSDDKLSNAPPNGGSESDALQRLVRVLRAEIAASLDPVVQDLRALERRLELVELGAGNGRQMALPPLPTSGYVPRLDAPPFIVDGPGYPADQELRELSRVFYERNPSMSPKPYRVSPLAIPVGLVYHPDARRSTDAAVRIRARGPEEALRERLRLAVERRTPTSKFASYLRAGWQWTLVRLGMEVSTMDPPACQDSLVHAVYERAQRIAVARGSEEADEREAFSTTLLWMARYADASRLKNEPPAFAAFCEQSQGFASILLTDTDVRWAPTELLSLWRSAPEHYSYRGEDD